MSKSPKTLTVTEQHQLLDALLCKDAPHKSFRKGIRNYLFACLMLEAGLRVGEVVALKISHLYFAGNPVETLILTPDITKNHQERSIPVSTRLKSAIKEYFSENEWLSDRASDCSSWFRFSGDMHITTRQVERIICSAAMECLGRRIHPHILRHTFATKLMRLTNIRTVQELLGHKNLSSTQVYTHPDFEDKKNAIDLMDQNDKK